MQKIFQQECYKFDESSRWCDQYLWDPIIGCTPVSPGCRICAAARTVARRGSHPHLVKDINGLSYFNGVVELKPLALLKVPYFSPGQQIFVCGRADLFHEQVPESYRDEIIECANQRPDCSFFTLTKRPENIKRKKFPKNFWVGITVENQELADRRLPYFDNFEATKVVSAKPLLGRIDISKHLNRFDMLCVGGEYGTTAKPMHPDWVRSLRDQCVTVGKPFSFHNWGLWTPGQGKVTRRIDNNGKFVVDSGTAVHIHEEGEPLTLLDGVVWDQYPDDITPDTDIAMTHEELAEAFTKLCKPINEQGE